METKQNLTILIVDDNPLNVKLLETALIKQGHQVISATNGKKARKIAADIRPDLILLDIVMPGENGFEVIRHLKKNPRTASLPVIFLTGRDDLDAKMTGFDLGAVDYITKPFHVQEVLARVRLHLKLSLATNSLIRTQQDKLKQIHHAQTSMLVTPQELPEAKFGAYYKALSEAGGDLYDVLQISEDIFGFFVGDVSGHDIATSYITAAVKALLKQNCIPVYEPHESMGMMNNVLTGILSNGKYMTFCYARLNRNTNHMTIVSGGHPPVVFLPVDGDARLIHLEGDVLGIFNNVNLGSEKIRVQTGDRFFLYTDGLIEQSAEKRIWTGGLQNVLEACSRLRGISIEESANKLTELLSERAFEAEDDIVVLGIEV